MLVLIALAAFGFFGFLLLWRTEARQKKSEKNAEQILDEAFDGREDVTFTINFTTLKYGDVVTGAKQRGYRLAHQAENQYGPHTLIFEKVSTESVG